MSRPPAVKSSYYKSISLVRVKFLQRIGLILHWIGLILQNIGKIFALW